MRAKRGIAKAGLFTARERRFVRQVQVEAVLTWALSNQEFAPFAALFLVSYIFLLRVPSEALPMRAGPAECHSCLDLDGDKLVLTLKRRKNKQGGSRLERGCWCSSSPVRWLLPSASVSCSARAGELASRPLALCTSSAHGWPASLRGQHYLRSAHRMVRRQR